MKATHYNDTIRHAIAYAEADRSDPFTFNRVMSHIANGICDDAVGPNGRLSEARYKADRNVDSNGRVYFSNLQRP
jgi:hypothetical protein